jgi:RND family efflux transporter MFP subunit
VVKIAQISTLRLRLPVPESLAPYVRNGDSATIHIDALNRTIAGTVARSTKALDPATRSMQVEVDVTNADGSLSPGMYAEVSLNIWRSGNALVLPINAVYRDGNTQTLYVVNTQNKVERRNVTLGVTTANQAEILNGLRDGEQVIIANQASFQPGELVTPKPSALASINASEAK